MGVTATRVVGINWNVAYILIREANIFTPRAHAQQGLSNRGDVCCLSVCSWTKSIENSNNKLNVRGYFAPKRVRTITTFELFFEDSSDSV